MGGLLHRETRGRVSLRTHATSGNCEDALLSVRFGVLTIHLESASRRGELTRKMVAVPVSDVLITLCPGHVDTLGLSLKSQSESAWEGIVLCCKDQTARNKWIAVFRRVEGVALRAGHYV